MRQTPEIYSLFAPHRTSARRESTSASLRLARSRQAHQSLDAITIHHTPSHWPRPPPFRPCVPPVVSLERPHGPAAHVDSHATAPRLACGIDASRASANDKAPLSARFAGFRLSPLSPSTSGAGPSGLRPEDVKEALRSCTGDTMLRLLGEVVALMLQCQVLVSVPACLWSGSRNPLLKIASPHKNRSAAGTTRRHAPDHQIAVQDWLVPNLRLTLRVFL